MRRLLVLALLVLLVPTSVGAQVLIIDTSKPVFVDFASPEHSAVIPAGSPGAGGPLVTGYQAIILDAAADAVSGTPLIIGPVVQKASATASGNPTLPFRLTLAQFGIGFGAGAGQIPLCLVVAPAPCPRYTLVGIAVGPGGAGARSTTAESGPFSLPALVQTPPPAGLTGVSVHQ